MATPATTAGVPDAPLVSAPAQLKALVDQLVTITTGRGEVTGVVLSCTRVSVWLVVDDDDVVVSLDDVVRLRPTPGRAAA